MSQFLKWSFFLYGNMTLCFFFFFEYIASWSTRDSIIGGLSSNQVTKWIPFACCVKACADLFPCCLTCWTLTRLNSCNFCWMLSRTSITVAWWNGGARQSSENHVGISFKDNFLYANIPCKRNRYAHRLCFSLQRTKRQVQMLTESYDDCSCTVPNHCTDAHCAEILEDGYVGVHLEPQI